eukprot:GHVU01028720.1.p1 GENE.GHVU01028720.1~~GHVU01028720.1.p1  ORF type:complete len:195 (+),score=23.22 GHVU01028720.1:2189-2773(+)
MLEDDTSRAALYSAKTHPKFCPVIYKGTMRGTTAEYSAKPGIFVDPRTGRIKVSVSTTAASLGKAEYLVTNGRARHHAWTHVAVVRHVTRLRVYINGILDSTMLTVGTTLDTKHPLYVGGTPWLENACDMPLLIDELRVYSIAIGRDQVQAEASPALGGLEPSFIHVACVDCTKVPHNLPSPPSEPGARFRVQQ